MRAQWANVLKPAKLNIIIGNFLLAILLELGSNLMLQPWLKVC